MLILPDKTEIHLTHVFTDSPSWSKGLSGVLPQHFGARDGALFVFPKRSRRSFWMPDTHFDLDIIFLDGDLVITHIQRNVLHHPSREEVVPRIPPQWADYVLEIKSRTDLARSLKKGMPLVFRGRNSLLRIRSGTRP